MKIYREPELESEAFFNHPAELLRKLEKQAGLPAESLELQKTEIYLPQLSIVSALKLYTEIFNIYSTSRWIQVRGWLKQRKNEVPSRVFATAAQKAESEVVDAHESPSRFCGYAEIRLEERQ